MIRRRFLNLFALLPFAGGMVAARAATAAPAAGLLPGRVDLLLRLGRIHALRRMIDACDRDLDAIRAKYDFKPLSGGPAFHVEWFAEAAKRNSETDPIKRGQISVLIEQLSNYDRATGMQRMALAAAIKALMDRIA